MARALCPRLWHPALSMWGLPLTKESVRWTPWPGLPGPCWPHEGPRWTDWGTSWLYGADFGDKSRAGRCAQCRALPGGAQPFQKCPALSLKLCSRGTSRPGILGGVVTNAPRPGTDRQSGDVLAPWRQHLPGGSPATLLLGREANGAAAWRGLAVAPALEDRLWALRRPGATGSAHCAPSVAHGWRPGPRPLLPRDRHS